MKRNHGLISSHFKTLCLICFFLLPLFSFATVRYVPSQYANIQAAIDVAVDGDEIVVSPGTYYENINFSGENIILRSTDPTNPSVVASTVIDGNNAGSVVNFAGGELPQCVLSGFTITNGSAIHGGGIFAALNAVTIRNNIITGNSASGIGGGIASSHGIIENNIISDNTAYRGGGLGECYGTIRNNIIRNNIASGAPDNMGGGLFGCEATILNNTISGNSAPGSSGTGGGIAWSRGTIINNTIYGNSAGQRGGGVWLFDGLITNCIIWGNSAPSDSEISRVDSPFYSCVQSKGDSSRATITADPRFVDPANGDFHLQSNSPCIDAGNKYYLYGSYLADIDSEYRIAGNNVDMGSDECNSSPDSDGDLLLDSEEGAHGCNVNNPDTDGDGLLDGFEVIRGTNPVVFNIPPGITIPAIYPSIQQALFLAFPTEEITLSPGTYYENTHILGKNIGLQSADPLNPNIVNSTIINGKALFSVIFFEGTEDPTCVVKGITIRGGSAQSGGGINGSETKATIENNKIIYNTASNDSAGISRCNGIIQNNIIAENWSSHYGGGLCHCSEATIQNNIISGNSASIGGGLYRCDGPIQNNTIWGNSATGATNSRGGGLYDCETTIRNCIIWANTSVSGAQLYDCYTPSYSCIQNWTGGGTGNITDNPQLVDAANGDFHLLWTSPCIDSGCAVSGLAQDFEGDPRPFNAVAWEFRGDGSDFDIGADEFSERITSAKLWQLYE